MVDIRAKSGKAAFIAALAAVAVGAGGLIGWICKLETLKRILPGLVAMNPAAAVAFMLAGISLMLFLQPPAGQGEKSRTLMGAARLCALLVMLTGLAKLLDLLCGWHLNVDQWLFAPQLRGELRFPNRMAPNAALNFLLLGGVLLVVDVKKRNARLVAEFAMGVVGFSSLLAILSYAYGVQSFYQLGTYIPMAPHSAITFTLLVAAFSLAHTDRGFLSIFIGNCAAGTMSRRLLPAVVLIPAVLGWLELQGELTGIYDKALGNALFAVGNIVIFTLLVCWTASALSHADIARKKAEEALQRQKTELRTLFDLMPAQIWFKDTENRLLLVNKRLAQAAGKTVAEIEGKSAQDIYPQDAATYYANDLEVIRSGVPQLGSVELVRDLTGQELWLQTDKVPYYDKAGKIIGIVAMAQDITERKRSENALRESEGKFRQLAENITDMFWITSPDMQQVHYISPAYERIWGRPPASLYARPREWADAIQPEDLPGMRAAFIRLATTDPQVSMEFRVRQPDGTVRWVSCRGFQVRDATGKLIRLTGIVSDITEQKRMDEIVRCQAAIIEHSADAIISKTLTGIITSWNPAAEKMFGYTADEIVGQPLQLISPPERANEESEILAAFARGELVRHFETVRIRKDGQRFDVAATISPIIDTSGSLVGLSKIVRDITARKLAEAALRETSALLEALLNNTTDDIYFKDRESRFIHFSRVMLKGFKLTHASELNGRTDFDFFSEEHAQAAFVAEQKIIRTGLPIFNVEEKETYLDGHVSWVLTSKMPWRDKAGDIIGTMGISRDITERKRMEEQLFQSQKLETVGKLAGGIAHEFNSILTAIMGQSELLLNDLPGGSPLVKNVTEINQAAGRASTLTRQLLAYGRKLILRPEILDLNVILAGMESTLHHLTDGSVEVRVVPATGLKAVKVDAGQMEQVIASMTINAREAMPNGGKLTLETANFSFGQESVGRYPELKPGDYVILAITDTGTGMSPEVKTRAFEPFFTTKGTGQGTGLGLSTCYGIVKQSGGNISVYSEPGRGTTFKIYLPQAEPAVGLVRQQPPAPGLPHGMENILLVEDDPALREMAATLLRRLGYTVWAAANGVEALKLRQESDIGHVDLMFTDLVMPHMSGKELADRTRELYPGTKILFTSAFTENAVLHQGVLDPGVALLQKPFTPSELAHKLREVLDAPGDAESGHS